MLFKRLFNWIKFKTLPPFVLFKNRLFVERDSKSRRVTSNLGLTYRNSKWTNYTRTDIPTNAKHSYINYCKTLFVTILFITICLSYTKFYTTTVMLNDTLFFFWWLKDTTFYYFFTIFSVWTILSTTLLEKVFSYFFIVKEETEETFVTPSNKLTTTLTTYKLGDYKHIYYNWLTNSLNSSEFTRAEEDLVMLFEEGQTNSRLIPQLTLLTKTFEASSVLRRSALLCSPDDVLKSDFKANSLNPLSLERLKSLELNYYLNSRNQEFTTSVNSNFSTSLKFLNSASKWNFNSIVQANENSTNLLHNSNGSFFITGWNFAKYNNVWVNQPNTYTLYESLENQLNSLKVSKFLYHYSYLHRNILKNSHKLTMVKKLMSSGFYDTKLISNNMWASDVFSKLANPDNVLNSELNLIYGNFFKTKFFNKHLLSNYSINTSINSLNLLSFYEKSYFFTLKRLHNFNSLFANKIQFTLKPFTQSSFNSNTETNSALNTTTLALKSDFIVTNRFLNYNLPVQNFTKNSTSSINSLTSTKDLFLVKTELSLITSDEESILMELSNSPSSSTPIYPFFTNQNNSASSFLHNTAFKKPTKLNLSSESQTSSLFINSTFLNDVRKLSNLL